jgi:hypothetical protein
VAAFVVLSVLSIVAVAGLAALASVRGTVAAAGRGRQLAQTRYLGELALGLGAGELGGPVGDALVRALLRIAAPCAEPIDGVSCIRLDRARLEELRKLRGDEGGMLVPAVGGGASGSLGEAAIAGDFWLELTDPIAGPPLAGTDLGGGAATRVRHYAVTTTATGRVGRGGGDAVWSASLARARAQLLVGPLAP